MYTVAGRRRPLVGLVCAAALVLTLAACGEEKTGSGGNSPKPPASVDPALAEKVPPTIRTKGTIAIGTDASYAPNEFLDTDGKTIIGFDVDLFTAVAGRLGLTTAFQSAKFDDIIPGVSSGKYDIGVSSFTINPERLQEVTMVSYFQAGTQWAQKVGGSVDPANACGKKVAVQTGTVQVGDATTRSKTCTDAGAPAITIEQYQAQSDATAAVVSGKDDAVLADSPVVAYAVKQSGGQLATLGGIYDSAPYGYALPRNQTDFAGVLAEAVRALIADGTYRKILDSWGVAGGSITTPAVNPTS
jgi:polar amino acid transport system substrate-binding protein